MYYKGSVPEAERSPKIQTAFSAGDSTEKVDQNPKSSSGFFSFPSINPKDTTSSLHSQSTKTGNGYEKVQYYDVATEQRAKFEKASADYAKRKENGEHDEFDEDSDSYYDR
ncbi:uncharacterized protein LOC118482723 [Helianthus annuus]|uniref:uncharacterized protein LOC118482723 n=1 Tax=Helianthus annuus TaxID=4232 RepID=UPI0016532792|nr:uncharacterized protein LOC118482723 [Helianthus annuus]